MNNYLGSNLNSGLDLIKRMKKPIKESKVSKVRKGCEVTLRTADRLLTKLRDAQEQERT